MHLNTHHSFRQGLLWLCTNQLLFLSFCPHLLCIIFLPSSYTFHVYHYISITLYLQSTHYMFSYNYNYMCDYMHTINKIILHITMCIQNIHSPPHWMLVHHTWHHIGHHTGHRVQLSPPLDHAYSKLSYTYTKHINKYHMTNRQLLLLLHNHNMHATISLQAHKQAPHHKAPRPLWHAPMMICMNAQHKAHSYACLCTLKHAHAVITYPHSIPHHSRECCSPYSKSGICASDILKSYFIHILIVAYI